MLTLKFTTMKTIKYITVLLLALSIFSACKPDELTPIGDPRNVVKQVAGTYTLTKVVQTDNDAVKKGFPYKTMDITKFYTGLKATFSVSAEGAPSTFTFTPAAGSNSIVTLASGNWSVDNADAPKVISLKNGTVTETIQLGAYTALDNNKLLLKIVRTSGANTLITYDYEFAKN